MNEKSLDNLASYNFLGVLGRSEINEKAIATMRSYGVGTCGPPGFYGTLGTGLRPKVFDLDAVDIHIELEQAIADFLRVPSAILYSQNYSAVTSAIPAFAKRGDIIV